MSRYTLVELVQGSVDWWAWRHDGIGGSDASIVLGTHHHKNASDLLWAKVSRAPLEDDPRPDAMRGQVLEPQARDRYVNLVGRPMRPVCLESAAYPWMRASLDGLSSDGTLAVEIKCPRELGYAAVRDSRCVPEHHRAQLQHTLAVTGLKAIDFWCYDPDNGGVRLVEERDDVFIARLFEAESAFWQEVQRRRALAAV